MSRKDKLQVLPAVVQIKLPLSKLLKGKNIWDINSTQAQAIHYVIGEMIAVDCQPYSIVEDVGFSRLMKKIETKLSITQQKIFFRKDFAINSCISKCKSKDHH